VKKLSNIKTADFRRFLVHLGLKKIRTAGDHEIWTRADLLRPVVIQDQIEIPEFIVKNNLRTIGVTRQEFVKYLEENT
jgi:predicted RNA binding protein YcfA (HicA-like mRNA interferase family)